RRFWALNLLRVSVLPWIKISTAISHLAIMDRLMRCWLDRFGQNIYWKIGKKCKDLLLPSVMGQFRLRSSCAGSQHTADKTAWRPLFQRWASSNAPRFYWITFRTKHFAAAS